MSEPIIIETPAPPTRERLVLVPPSCVTEEYESQAGPRLGITGGVARDATPADLERAGYVTGEMLAEHVRIVWAAGQEAEPVGVAMLRRLKDRAEKAERVAAMAKDIDGHTMADLRDDLRNASARYDEVWAALGTTSALANDTAPNIILAMREDIIGLNADTERLLARAEKAERERDEARRLHSDAEAQVACRNELRAQVAAAEGRFRAAEAERDTLRAELARLTAPGDVGLLNSELVEAIRPGQEYTHRGFDVVELRAAYRLGVAHERARLAAAGVTLATADEASDEAVAADLRAAGVDPEALAARWLAFVRECQRQLQGRATDEELVDLYRKAYETHGGRTIDVSHDDCRRAAILAAAARVRQERCLVAQAVAADCDIHVTEQISGMWCVRVVAQTSSTAAGVSATVPRADAPSTLARLLGEVSRG